jgi:ABC-type polysaccharide/polyol phosphate export permease
VVRLLVIVREPVLEGRIPPLKTFMIATLATLAVTAVALLFLQRLQKRIILYL